MSDQEKQPLKAEDSDQAQLNADNDAGIVRVLRLRFDGTDMPDLILNHPNALRDEMLWNVFGEDGEFFDDLRLGKTLTVSIEEMPRAEFEALGEWEP